MTNSVELAKRSHQLSVNLDKASNIELNECCQFTLAEASAVADEAGKGYMSKNIDYAKSMMKSVSQDLAYTAVENFSQSASIPLCKKEADSILANS